MEKLFIAGLFHKLKRIYVQILEIFLLNINIKKMPKQLWLKCKADFMIKGQSNYFIGQEISIIKTIDQISHLQLYHLLSKQPNNQNKQNDRYLLANLNLSINFISF